MARKALAVAVDSYAAPYTTYNNVLDQTDMKSALQANGFTVSVLTNSGATRANILASLTGLVQLAQPGDSICFAFFGHGGKAPSPQEPDGTAECLCCHDWQAGGLVWDFDVDRIISSYLRAGVNVDLVFGCCFAGGIVEGSRVVSWQACGEDEYAWVLRTASGNWRGVYLNYLCNIFRNYSAYSRTVLHNAVYQAANRLVGSQHPVLRGTPTELSQPPFA